MYEDSYIDAYWEDQHEPIYFDPYYDYDTGECPYCGRDLYPWGDCECEIHWPPEFLEED